MPITAVCAVLFGVIPALHPGGHGGPAWLHSGVRAGAAGGREARRLRDGLVVFQVALSLILLGEDPIDEACALICPGHEAPCRTKLGPGSQDEGSARNRQK